jgi:hypothetical protein
VATVLTDVAIYAGIAAIAAGTINAAFLTRRIRRQNREHSAFLMELGRAVLDLTDPTRPTHIVIDPTGGSLPAHPPPREPEAVIDLTDPPVIDVREQSQSRPQSRHPRFHND